MAEMEQLPQEWREYEPIQPKGFDWRGLARRLWAPIAAIGAFLATFFLTAIYIQLAMAEEH